MMKHKKKKPGEGDSAYRRRLLKSILPGKGGYADSKMYNKMYGDKMYGEQEEGEDFDEFEVIDDLQQEVHAQDRHIMHLEHKIRLYKNYIRQMEEDDEGDADSIDTEEDTTDKVEESDATKTKKTYTKESKEKKDLKHLSEEEQQRVNNAVQAEKMVQESNKDFV